MKIKAVRHLYEKDLPSSLPGMAIKKGDLKCWKATDVLPCCLAMKEAWDEGFVGFGERDDSLLNKVGEACIYRCSPYSEGAVWHELPISVCPWCAARIEISGVPA
jgi:hypothetical protein